MSEVASLARCLKTKIEVLSHYSIPGIKGLSIRNHQLFFSEKNQIRQNLMEHLDDLIATRRREQRLVDHISGDVDFVETMLHRSFTGDNRFCEKVKHQEKNFEANQFVKMVCEQFDIQHSALEYIECLDYQHLGYAYEQAQNLKRPIYQFACEGFDYLSRYSWLHDYQNRQYESDSSTKGMLFGFIVIFDLIIKLYEEGLNKGWGTPTFETGRGSLTFKYEAQKIKLVTEELIQISLTNDGLLLKIGAQHKNLNRSQMSLAFQAMEQNLSKTKQIQGISPLMVYRPDIVIYRPDSITLLENKFRTKSSDIKDALNQAFTEQLFQYQNCYQVLHDNVEVNAVVGYHRLCGGVGKFGKEVQEIWIQ